MGGMVMPDGYTLGTGPITYNSKKYAKDNTDIIKITVVDSRGNSSTAELKVNISGVFFQAYIASAKATREDGNGKKVKLECIGKISDYETGSYPNANITINYTVRDIDDTMTLQTGTIGQESITYNEDNTFKVDSYIKGDLGAEGFTQDVEFIVNLTCAGQLFTTYPTNFNNILVDKGKILQDITEEGFAFGTLYNTDLGGALQVNNARIDYDLKDDVETPLFWSEGGKQLYVKKMIVNGNITGSGKIVSVSTGLNNVDIKRIVGVAKHANGATDTLPSNRLGSACGLCYMQSNSTTRNEIEIQTESDYYKEFTFYVYLYYTKNS